MGRVAIATATIIAATFSATGPALAPAGADVNSVGGGAGGLSLDLVTNVGNPGNIIASDTALVPSVQLPTNGEQTENGASNLVVQATETSPPGTIQIGSAASASVTTRGGQLGSHTGCSESTANLTGVELLGNYFGGVQADAVSAQCHANGDGTTGTAQTSGLRVFGLEIADSHPPNTDLEVEVEVGGETRVVGIALNEQDSSSIQGQSAEITVNAVHIEADLEFTSGEFRIDMILGQARCQVFGPDVLTGEPPGAGDPAPTTVAPTTVPPSTVPPGATATPVRPAGAIVAGARFAG